ncbi:MAG: SapC family protein [Hoeflea sp.]|uniref:SapC family protein n=1 Tax=Hoeflea sp. TaxID=1940281 RepID=UPI001E194250|nr:SapC family protein [Hoeflea sp.]MBU4528613.1 SapC family protein [Alphaproteobacteria bacterium]MBU4545582.1 SapC family protein [Alphaproteobacteria bacterium]MBU4552192.1 SapC family protein [Alphaproteobacteria bacterium]MBV1726216.1 SapC family protein [Hoeflea sp.]MBV1762357.1 SapC family protein [Hoeflea sp.]
MTGSKDKQAEKLPLFYKSPEALNRERHGGKGLALSGDLGFAANAIVIPLMAAEMPAAMRSYPIVFSGPDYMPMVITGIRDGENLFINSEGKWAEPHYVPAYVRRYPFILAGGETDERLTLCIENDPARLVDFDAGSGKEVKPFFEDSDQSEVIKSALSFCEQYQGMFVKTRQIMKVIADSGLLAERTSKITLGDGQNFNITGFHLVDEAKLLAMSDEDFLKLRKADALATVYCHLASMNSWTSLLHQASLRNT